MRAGLPIFMKPFPQWLEDRLPKTKFGRALVTMASGSALVQVIGLLSAPIMARVFDPTETGISAVFLNMLAIVSGLAFLRFEQALPLPQQREERIVLLALCLVLLPVSTILVAVATILGRHWIAGLLNEPSLASYLWVLPLALGLAGTVQMLANWFTREGEFGTIIKTRLKQSCGQIGFQVGVGALARGNAWVLVWGGVLGNLIALGCYLRALPSGLGRNLMRVSWTSLKSAAFQYRRFPVYNSWSTLIDTLAPSIPVFALTALHGPQTTGWYRMAQTLVTLPVSAIGNAVMNVYWSEAARQARENPAALGRLYRRLTLRLAGLGGLLVLGSLTLPLIVPILFGAKWAEAGTYAVIVSIPAAFSLMSMPAVNLSTLPFNHWEAAWISLRMVLIALATWASWAFQMSPVGTLIIFSAVLVAGYACLIFLNLLALKKIASVLEPGPAIPAAGPEPPPGS